MKLNYKMLGLLLIFLLGISRASSLTSISTYTNPDGLIAYWDFAQCTGTSATDRGDWGNTGTLTGGATNLSWVGGKYGCGLSFVGTYAYVSTSNVSILDLGATPFTISSWVYPSSLTGTHAILGKSNPANYFPSIDILLQGADVRFVIYNNSASGVDITGGATLSLNIWAYIVVSWNTTHACIYFNGILTPNGCQSASIISPTNIYPIYLGNQGQLNIQFLGNIDEYKIWRRVLSAEEVYVDYLGTYANIENYYANASAFLSLNSSIFLVGSNLTTFYNSLASNITNNYNAIATNLTTLQNQAIATNNSATSYYNNLASNSTNNFNAIAKNLTDMNSTLIATNNSLNSFYNNLANNLTSVNNTIIAVGANVSAINIGAIATNLTNMNSTLVATNNSLQVLMTASASNFMNTTAMNNSMTSYYINLGNNITSVNNTVIAVGTNLTAYYHAIAANMTSFNTTSFAMLAALGVNITSVNNTVIIVGSNLTTNMTRLYNILAAIAMCIPCPIGGLVGGGGSTTIPSPMGFAPQNVSVSIPQAPVTNLIAGVAGFLLLLCGGMYLKLRNEKKKVKKAKGIIASKDEEEKKKRKT